ncbi:MAG: hypothetical protein M1828_007012 [Chrysothrix sp. TS-e1954]|nr:MAG: hypothetical protein M1828_007012 [Chrysothrix sp. TS-e1954]
MEEEELDEAALTQLTSQHFRGVARVSISTLSFHGHFPSVPRELSSKVLTRLQHVFRIEGCRRLDEENQIPALVTAQHLSTGLAEAGLTSEQLTEIYTNTGQPPFLSIPTVHCLHGLHRVQAAQRFLHAEEDQWWTVKLYSAELPIFAAKRIVELHANNQPFSDGEIYYKARTYSRAGDGPSERKWLARLSPGKRKDLNQLMRDASFMRAFDKLLAFPGLWQPVELGMVHRLLALKCDEELLSYLGHIYTSWEAILCGQSSSVALDAATARQLELLAPSSSWQDAQKVRDLMRDRHIFPDVSDDASRQLLLDRLLTFSGLVPTLRTFFENLKYLEPCCQVLKQLLSLGPSTTLRKSYCASYSRGDRLLFEWAEGAYKTSAGVTFQSDRRSGYQQLWLFAMRHFPELSAFTPRKEQTKEKPRVNGANPAIQSQFAELALKLGFRTRKALDLQSRNTDKALATQFLHFVNIPREGSHVLPLVHAIKSARQASYLFNGSSSIFSAELTAQREGPDARRRCGRPFEDDFFADRDSLFLPQMCQASPSAAFGITPFYVKYDLFRCLFGYVPTQEVAEALTTAEELGHSPTTPETMDGTDEAQSNSIEQEQQILALQQQLQECQDQLLASNSVQGELAQAQEELTGMQQENSLLSQTLQRRNDQVIAQRQTLEARESQISRLSSLRHHQVDETQEWSSDSLRRRLTDEASWSTMSFAQLGSYYQTENASDVRKVSLVKRVGDGLEAFKLLWFCMPADDGTVHYARVIMHYIRHNDLYLYVKTGVQLQRVTQTDESYLRDAMAMVRHFWCMPSVVADLLNTQRTAMILRPRT